MNKKKSLIVIQFVFSFLIILAMSLYADTLISFSMHKIEKEEQSIEMAIHGINTAKGIAMTGETIAAYKLGVLT